jgi:serine/threonine protein kinase
VEPLLEQDPKRLGDFTIIGRLGEGGMGTVFLGARGTRNAAIKVMHPALLRDPSARTRFEREIKILEKIDSPQVARILEHGIDGDQGWFATEFINGPDLKSLVEEHGPLDEETWDLVANQLLIGLQAIHRAGIIHRDIKPSNLVLSDAGLKIVDFGIAQMNDMTSITVSGLISGSPAWFSPEQIEGKLLSPATDMFSAGSVLTYAATGRSPWGNPDQMSKAMVFGILAAKPNLTGLNPRARAIVERLLSKEPENRIGNLDALLSPSNDLSKEPSRNFKAVSQSVKTKQKEKRPKPAADVPGRKANSPEKPSPRSPIVNSSRRTSIPRTELNPSQGVTQFRQKIPSNPGRRWALALLSLGVVAISLFLAFAKGGNQELLQPEEAVSAKSDASQSVQAETDLTATPAKSAVECDTFLCALAVGFEESIDGVTIWVWSRDSSVYTVYDISLQITDAASGEQLSNLGDCEGTVDLLPAGNWTSGTDGGTTWKRICRYGVLEQGNFANFSVSRGGNEWLSFTVRPENAVEQPQSDWGAQWYQLDRVREFEPSKNASPDMNEVFRNEIFSLTFAGGLDYGLGPQELFNRYYSISDDGNRIIRQDCPLTSAQPEWHPIQAKNPLENSWITLGNASFSNGCERGNLRTFEISTGSLQTNFPGFNTVDFRFLNPHPFERINPTTQWEAWEIRFN